MIGITVVATEVSRLGHLLEIPAALILRDI